MEYLGTTVLTIILAVLFIYFTNKNILKKTQSKLDIINRYKIALLKILNESKIYFAIRPTYRQTGKHCRV